MLNFVRAMHDAGKPVAFICHAGVRWVDQEVVVDGIGFEQRCIAAEDSRMSDGSWH